MPLLRQIFARRIFFDTKMSFCEWEISQICLEKLSWMRNSENLRHKLPRISRIKEKNHCDWLNWLLQTNGTKILILFIFLLFLTNYREKGETYQVFPQKVFTHCKFLRMKYLLSFQCTAKNELSCLWTFLWNLHFKN